MIDAALIKRALMKQLACELTYDSPVLSCALRDLLHEYRHTLEPDDVRKVAFNLAEELRAIYGA